MMRWYERVLVKPKKKKRIESENKKVPINRVNSDEEIISGVEENSAGR